ncbi:hypothetical protein CPC08DRAFT_719086 [Agrocybe pediades]|nr:hypothetical protein CPC08DRAFT_719086 [Agrocybe pediades]
MASEVTQRGEKAEHPEGVLNGTVGQHKGEVETVEVEGDGEGEESDDYEEEGEGDVDYDEEKQVVGDEDDEDDEGEDDDGEGEGEDDVEEDNGQQNGLTHLLLGNPNAPVSGDDIGDEEDEEDDDDEYTEEPVAPSAKKRGIDEVADDEDGQGAKKVKA